MLRVCLLLIGIWIGAWAWDPEVLYLTWMHDPASTMVIQWHSGPENARSEVASQKVGDKEWRSQKGWVRTLRGTDILLHEVELTGLQPDTVYGFRIDNELKVYRFRTMPKSLTRKVRFAVGGDVYDNGHLYREMNKVVAKQDPDFVVLGGDIAYTTGRKRMFKGRGWEAERWEAFFKEWKSDMVTSDGRLIPMIVTVGNHDVKSGKVDPRKEPAMFYEMFAFPTWYEAFREMVFGDYLQFVLLDTNHTWSVESQTPWLKGVLGRKALWKMVGYHIAAFPSYYPYNGNTSVKIRENWVPLFEKSKVDIVFEHHNHCYKRTVPMNGVLYLGDGSWGVEPREPHPADYLAKTAQVNSVFVVTLENGKCTIKPLGNDGRLIEEPIEIGK